MGVYSERVLPRLVDLSCGTRGLARWRDRATEGLAGVVVEIGFGSGLNLEHYPDGVRTVLAVEPSSGARRLAGSRLSRTSAAVEFIGLDGQSLPLDDESCDAALCTFTLCTIPDAHLALQEVRRVLRPGGALHFLEHGLADDPGVASWQRRLDPIQQRLAGGCHLTRVPDELAAQAGFDVEVLHRRFAKGPKPWSFFTVGRATKPC